MKKDSLRELIENNQVVNYLEKVLQEEQERHEAEQATQEQESTNE